MDHLLRARIGYAPLSSDLGEPGDRRRFVHYANRRGLSFEVPKPGGSYDVIVLSQRADIGAWSQTDRGGPKLVYDAIDSYLAEPFLKPRALLRGVAKFATRETTSFHANYRRQITRMLSRADAVICSTSEQRLEYEKFCPNVHTILDVQTEVQKTVKVDYSIGEMVNIVWEGLPYTIRGFREIAGSLRRLSARRSVALHLITAPAYGRVGGRLVLARTRDLVGDLGVPTYFYDWSPETLAGIATSCDFAVIPLNLADPFARGKPENKLLGLWRLGLPVITSATPAYARAMAAAGQDLHCRTAAEWDTALERLISSQPERRKAGVGGLKYADSAHSEDQTLGRWDAMFASLFQ